MSLQDEINKIFFDPLNRPKPPLRELADEAARKARRDSAAAETAKGALVKAREAYEVAARHFVNCIDADGGPDAPRVSLATDEAERAKCEALRVYEISVARHCRSERTR
jgi:hypothetical protein